MQDDPPPRAKRLLRKGVCIVAPILLIAATVYAKVIARRRWEGRAAVKGYGDVFKRQAIKESAKLKGATAQWVPFEARTHPDTPTKLWGNVKRPFPTGAWWTNLVVGGPSSSGDGLGTAFATPYTVAVLPDKGVVLGYGEVLATNDSLTLATS
jgi:endoglucanase Acf2